MLIKEPNIGLNASLDELLKGKKTGEIVGPNGLLKQLTNALLERAMHGRVDASPRVRDGAGGRAW